jgi:hypothetical protein
MFKGYEVWAAYKGLTGFLNLAKFIPVDIDGSHKSIADKAIEDLTASNRNPKIYYRLSCRYGR